MLPKITRFLSIPSKTLIQKGTRNSSLTKNKNSFKDINSLYSPASWIKELEKDFFQFPFNKPTSNLNNYYPALPNISTDVIEQKDKYVITADLPGMQKENIKASLKDGYVQIAAERTETKERDLDEKDKRFHRQERYYGKVVRSIPLPSDITHDFSQIKGNYKSGVLTLEIPKDLSFQHDNIKQIQIHD